MESTGLRSVWYKTSWYHPRMKKFSLKSRFNDSPVALHRLEVIEFYLKYGTQPTMDAFKISKRTLFRWKHIYISSHKDPNSLIPHSKRPLNVRTMQVNIDIVNEIKRIRYLYGCIGKRKIKVLLDEYCKENGYPCISISTVGKVIKRYNMISLNKRIYHNPNTKRIHRYTATKVKYAPKSNAYGYVEVDTILRFVNGMRLYVFNAVDIHTKFEFAYGYTSNTTRSSVDFLNKLESVYPIKNGIHTIQTDNGSEYLGKFHEQVLRKGKEYKAIENKTNKDINSVEKVFPLEHTLEVINTDNYYDKLGSLFSKKEL